MVMRSRPIPNIIQGISQQTAQERRDAQCEYMQDCINYPTRGVVARPGVDVNSFTPLPLLSGAFTYEVLRGSTEHYLFIIHQGQLLIYDLNTFLPCDVTPLATTYLSSPAGVLDVDNFRIQTVGDYHFLINRSVIPQMNPASVSQNPNPAAIVFVQAGNYLTTYSISVEYAGSVYTYAYQTPDNSVSTNYQYIATNQIAATFFRAMTGITANSAGTGPIAGQAGSTQGGATGDTYNTVFTPYVSSSNVYTYNAGAGNVTGTTTTLTSLGFTVKINGNLLLIERASDKNPFTVDASDGAGDSTITVIQDVVQDLSDLPRGGFQNYCIQVMGVGGNNNASAPYYLKYDSTAANGGAWVESVANNTLTNFDFTTMPLAIFRDAPDSFQVIEPNWLPRISGDGTTSAFTPGFVGNTLTDIAYYDGRLVLLGESTYDFTMANNVFNFWPQTAQTQLDAAPISGQLAASNTTSTIEQATVVDEQLVLWAQRAQFRINSGIQAFTAINIQDPQSTAYEFNANCPFFHEGTSIYFAYDSDGFSRIFVLQYQQGRAEGDTEITAHVPEFIPIGVRAMSGSVPIKMMFVRTDGAPDALYLYNWLNEGGSVVQSAWNVWALPAGQVIWHTIYQQYLYVLLQRTDGTWWVSCPLNPAHTDPGGTYTTRLDMRITEQGLKSTFNLATNTTLINLPYHISPSGEGPLMALVIRNTSGKYTRGTWLTPTATTATTITVQGDVSKEQFYVGLLINSVRIESPFYIRTATGHIPTERLTIKNYWVDYRNTIATDIIVTNTQTGHQAGQTINSQPSPLVTGQVPALTAGSLRALVDCESLDCTILLQNNTPFPSEWTSVNIEFESTERATPMLTPYGGPVQ